MSVQEMTPANNIGAFKNPGSRPDITGTPENPVFFQLRAQMLKQGRTNTPVCKTKNMWTVLKVYASGGENGLHTHTKEDHMFVVMQGSARFYGPNGETHDVKTHGGVLLPAHAYYHFHATSKEPLVLLRVGCKAADEGDMSERLNIKGGAMPGHHPDNKQVEVIYDEGKWFE